MRTRIRWGLSVLALLMTVAAAPRAEGGAEPATLPPDWLKVAPGPGAEIVQFIQALPFDPERLGVMEAQLRTERYPMSFETVRVKSLDETPLAGSLAMHRDGKPRPGVVLVPGFASTRDLKFMVELADLFSRNGWHVLTLDLRGHGESRALSGAPTSGGWKETGDVLGAVRYLRDTSKATSVAVIGFSMGGRSLVKAMAQDAGRSIAAGIAVDAALAAFPPITPPPPGYTPTPLERFFLDFLGTRSLYEYYERAARWYGVDIPTLQARGTPDGEITEVRAPLLLFAGTDSTFRIAYLRSGRHDGGPFSLAYRDAVRNHPYVRTLLVRRAMHAGLMYLQDPYWFGLAVLNYLKHWQARDAEHVTTAVPPLDILAEGLLAGESATYRFVMRNHGAKAVGPLDVLLHLPAGARLAHCYLGAEGVGRCMKDGGQLTWTIPRLSGGKATAGPFVAVVDVSSLKPGPFGATVAVSQEGMLAQRVTLEKK